MKILGIDIETAPGIAYIWSLWDKYIPIERIVKGGYTLCWSAKWLGKDKPESGIMFDSVQQSGLDDMIHAIWALLDEADAVVHYNGRKFDIPTLNIEFTRLGLPPPSPYHQIDLLDTVKRRFRFKSNKLDYVCQELGLGAKAQHKGMSLWTGCMEGNPAAWRVMERYNKQDVVLLERLYKHLLPWIQDHPNHALYMDTDRPVCTNCGSSKVHKHGFETTKVFRYQRYRCTSCGTPLRGRYTTMTTEERKNVLTGSKI